MAAGARRRRWLNLILVVALIVTILPGGAYAEPPAPSATPGALDDEPFGTALDATGGTIELMGQGQLFVPSGALPGRSRLYFHTVEMSASSGLPRYHPIDQAIHIEARRADDGSRINRLGRPATVRLQLNRPEVPQERVGQPEVRLLDAGRWVAIPSTYDPASMTVTCDIASLPATIAVVDGSLEPSAGDWDPKDPAAVQLSDGSWGVAYVDSVPNLLYRRTLDGSQPYFWRDRKTVDTNADSPALVKLGSTLALFYRKASGSYKQVHLRTSTDGGDNWSGPTVLTSGSVDVYQMQAVNDGGTVYMFWSLSNTSGLLQYRTSTDLANWSSPSSVGQAIGPLQLQTFPHFDVKKLASGVWALSWLNVSFYNGPSYQDRQAAGSTGYPVVWYASSADLTSGNWANKRELTLPYTERWARGLSLAQDSSGTLYLSYSRYKVHWDYYAYYRTSADGGASWAAATVYGYEPTRSPVGYTGVNALNSYLVVDGSGAIRSFWDQFAASTGGGDTYDAQLFYRDLPSGAITAIPPVKEILAICDGCRAESFGCGDPVDVATRNFTLTETDFSIPGRGPGLALARTYNAARLVDGPLGWGWRHSYQAQLSTYPNGEVLIVESSGQSDLYLPDGAGGYQPPPGRFAELVHNGDGTWTLTERNQVERTFSADGKLTAIADRNGNAVSLSYSNGLLSAVTDPAGRSLTFGYNGSRVGSVTDPLSRTVTFGYNGAGDLTSVTDKGGKAWTYSYDGSHRMLTRVDPNSHTVMANTYGSLGRVKGQRDARNVETKFDYPTSGQSNVTDGRGNVTTYYFDTSYRVTRISDPYNKTIYQYWDDRNNLTRIQDARRSPNDNTYFTHDDWGNVLTRRNGLDKTWTYTYNSFNDPLTAADPLGHTTVYTYSVSGNLIEMSNPEGETTLFGRDGYGQMTSIADGRGKTTTFGYDSYGNQATVTDPYSQTWTTDYDLAGRKESVTDPLDGVTSFDYDDGDNLLSITDGRGKVTSYGYDDVGNRTSVTDPNQKVTAYGYDEKNRLITVTDAISGTTTYGYDGNDNMTSLTDANGHSRTWTYDKNNLVLTETDAISKTTTYEYDGMGNRTKRIDANGASTTYAYDTIKRLTTITYPQGSVTYGYDDANRRTSMTDGTGTTSYAYDAADRLTSVTFPGSRVVGYDYDEAGNRTRVTYPDNKTVDYSYDDANRMSTVTDWLTNTTTYGYDEAGRLTTTSLPNGVVETRGYNGANQLTSIVAASGGITLTSFVYTLDDAGLRTAVQALDGVESYGYDDLYRLTGVTYSDAITQTYSYDAVGNRLSKDEGGNLTDYSYDNGDRMLTAGGVSYTYDNNGNQTDRGADTFGWDYENRLTSATVSGTSVSYVYRGDGLRHSKTVGGNTTTYTWDVNSGLPVVLQDGTHTYVYGLGLISQTDNSGNQSYFLGNGLGSTEALVDGSGNVIATYKYDVYGAVRSSSGSGNTEYRFTGQQDDADLGYTYPRARYYDQATGRFLSKDPFPGLPWNPTSWHSYAYVANNAANVIDLTGESPYLLQRLIDVLQLYGPPAIQTVQRWGAGAVSWMFQRGQGLVGWLSQRGQAVVNWCARVGERAPVQATRTVVFRSGHAAPHWRWSSIGQVEIEAAIEASIRQAVQGASSTGQFWGRVTVGGRVIEYRAFTLPDGVIQVGTYYEVIVP